MLKLPHFIVIGAMKSATSTLQDQLVQQPGIYMCDPKEPNFFSDDDQYIKGMGWYSGLFNDFPENSLLGEASTHYTKLPTFPKTVDRINKHLSDIRYIYVMRHPVDRLVSHYIHEWSMGKYTCDINEAISKYPELIEYSRYTVQLDPFLTMFGKENVLPVFFDRLIKHSQSELDRVCDFIGYKGKANWISDLKEKNISSKRIRKFPFYNLLVESKVAETVRRNLVPKQVRNFVKSKLRMQERPVIDNKNMEKIVNIFNQDLAILSKWIGREINCHNYKEITSSNTLDWL